LKYREINIYLERKFLRILGAGFRASIVIYVLSIGQVWFLVNHSQMHLLQNACSHVGAFNKKKENV
jgi:hypothetical protein